MVFDRDNPEIHFFTIFKVNDIKLSFYFFYNVRDQFIYKTLIKSEIQCLWSKKTKILMFFFENTFFLYDELEELFFT